MCITNKYADQSVVNGSVWVVREIGKDTIEVEFEVWFVNIERFPFEQTDDDTVVLTVCQFPLVLSWSFSIHKSQGMTIDYLYCDLTRVFAPSQTYVALSRARSLDGLFVQWYDNKRVKVDKKALEFYL
jgi:ATP-dependent exoDNAse (exonuclease V) alpha subunit